MTRSVRAQWQPGSTGRLLTIALSVQSDLDDDWIQEHEKQLVVLEGEKIRKKFEKENTKREAEGEKPLPEKELKERLKAADELEKTIKRDRKNGYEETKMSEERIVAALKKTDERIQVAKLAATDKDEGKGACFGSVLRERALVCSSAFRCADLCALSSPSLAIGTLYMQRSRSEPRRLTTSTRLVMHFSL